MMATMLQGYSRAPCLKAILYLCTDGNECGVGRKKLMRTTAYLANHMISLSTIQAPATHKKHLHLLGSLTGETISKNLYNHSMI